MTELFFDGYSEYELEALKIPSQSRGKCLPQLVDYTKCIHKSSILGYIFNGNCEDETYRFNKCHQRQVQYYSSGYLTQWIKKNPKAFAQQKVSPTLQQHIYKPTPLHIHFS